MRPESSRITALARWQRSCLEKDAEKEHGHPLTSWRQ